MQLFPKVLTKFGCPTAGTGIFFFFFLSSVSFFSLIVPLPRPCPCLPCPYPCHSSLQSSCRKLSAGLHTVHRRGNPISPPLSPHKYGTPAPARLLLARPAQASQALSGSWSTEVGPNSCHSTLQCYQGPPGGPISNRCQCVRTGICHRL